MRRRQSMTRVGFNLKLRGGRHVIWKRQVDVRQFSWIRVVLIKNCRCDVRLRAQELAGKTKTMHGDVSENCSGPHGTEKQCSIYEEIEQHIPGHCFFTHILDSHMHFRLHVMLLCLSLKVLIVLFVQCECYFYLQTCWHATILDVWSVLSFVAWAWTWEVWSARISPIFNWHQ
jgi:hypothetical protein